MPGNPLVEKVQKGLSALGIDPGKVDGLAGPKTKQAIEAFERSAGLPETGKATDEVLHAIDTAQNIPWWNQAPDILKQASMKAAQTGETIAKKFSEWMAPSPVKSCPIGDKPDNLCLGKNGVYAADIQFAADRAKMAPQAVAALINAEAAKVEGVWDAESSNAKSSARGMTQFLKGTWLGEAERAGTYLHEQADKAGYLDKAGKVLKDKAEDVLGMRNDPRQAITAATDYAQANLGRLAKDKLIPADVTDAERAKLMYLTHHLGVGDAEKYLKKTISEERAEVLLKAQVGEKAAQKRFDEAGSWVDAHRDWLGGYIDKNIDPSKFDCVKDAAKPAARTLEQLSAAVR